MVLEGLEKQLHIDRIARNFPRPAQYHVERCPLSLQLLQWEKRIQKGQSAFLLALQVALWEPLLWSHPLGVAWNLWGSTTGNLTVMEKGGACDNQYMDLGKQNSYLQCPSSNCNQKFCSSAELSWWCSLTRELGRVQIRLIQILKQGVMPTLKPGLPTAR